MFDQNASAHEAAYRHLVAAIRSGKLAPGSRLHSERLAELLGLSRTPIREALRRLQSEGLVLIRPNRTAVVAALTPEEILERFAMRATLERLAVETGRNNVTASLVDDLAHLAGRLRAGRSEVDRWSLWHEDFHDRLCGLPNWPHLRAMVRRLRMTTEPYVRMVLDVSGTVDEDCTHDAIVACLHRGAAADAASALERHILLTGRGVAALQRARQQAVNGKKPRP